MDQYRMDTRIPHPLFRIHLSGQRKRPPYRDDRLAYLRNVPICAVRRPVPTRLVPSTRSALSAGLTLPYLCERRCDLSVPPYRVHRARTLWSRAAVFTYARTLLNAVAVHTPSPRGVGMGASYRAVAVPFNDVIRACRGAPHQRASDTAGAASGSCSPAGDSLLHQRAARSVPFDQQRRLPADSGSQRPATTPIPGRSGLSSAPTRGIGRTATTIIASSRIIAVSMVEVIDARLQERPVSKTILPRSRRTPKPPPLSISHAQNVPVTARRFHRLCRAAIALGILEAA